MRFLLFFLLFSMPMAQAESETQAPIPPDFCAMVQNQQKQSATYTPGIDAKGKKIVSADINDGIGRHIVPADINNGFSKSIFPIDIPIEIELAERFDLDLANGIDLEPIIANFQVHEDGRVLYGDEDVTSRALELCGRHHAPTPKTTIEINTDE